MKSRLSLAAAAALLALLLSSCQAQEQDPGCNTTAKADIVLLVDGSWSIGRLNFKTIRKFIARVVSVFDIGPDKVQIGLTQYGSDTRTEWHLNAHPTKASLLHAIAKLPYKGGTTMTGLALKYILQNNFQRDVGMRRDSSKIVVLITDGTSQDEVVSISQELRDRGIELYAIGIAHIDEIQLKSIASDPDETHVYSVSDFEFLLNIVDDLTVNLRNSTRSSDHTPEAPTNLVTSEVTQSSFRATWTPPGCPVDKFRITYTMAAGGPTEELLVDGSVSTAVLENLNPQTEYVTTVSSIVGEKSSEPLRGTETTRDV
ncbi:collagen alpha-1(XII) chain-like [Archocentrus centrarchus]|uniref:collagen alpha-1(XII) chain-like n=1 Tax=Archocentrus centrarchus TaxID=63155 RepID=UPI0011EA3D33|nr:collagen alpha-1(XII) chain-like [Archocentrus centrarchus]